MRKFGAFGIWNGILVEIKTGDFAHAETAADLPQYVQYNCSINYYHPLTILGEKRFIDKCLLLSKPKKNVFLL